MAQPPYGQPQSPENPSPYGQPPQYEQSGYGQPPQYPASGGPGWQYPGGVPVKQGNGFAVAGVCLSILPLLGLIFSIIGLVKSGARGGAGKVLSIIGIVLSLVFAGVGFAISSSISGSTAADPGCIAAESNSRALMSKMTADDNSITKDTNNQTAEKADLAKLDRDLQAFETDLNSAAAKATHPSVKAKVGKMSSDLNGMLTALKAVENGNLSQASAVDSYGSKLGADGDAIDQICAPFGSSSGS